MILRNSCKIVENTINVIGDFYMKDNNIEIINIFHNEDDEKKSEIITQIMQKIINSRINSGTYNNDTDIKQDI